MRLVPGEAFGRYRIEAEVGRGGQAVVFRATQLDLDRQVALKVFDAGYLTRAGAVERFRREAVAAGRLEHPRIVPVYDAGEVEGRAYIAMRLVAGDTLADRIARGGPLPPGEALAVLEDIAGALDFAHARGTIHRDVKPANILLDPGGAAYLSDFGLVHLDDMPGLTKRGDWLGTAEYVSPEQVEGEPATTRSDLYALAVVAFEALTGGAPFVRREPSAVLLAHVRDPAPDASAVRPAIPPAASAALAAGLAKSPGERPASAGRLVDDLRAALGPDAARAPADDVAAASAEPWDAALSRFAGPAGEAPADRPTNAFGDAARRRRIAMGRDMVVAASVALSLLVGGAVLGGWMLGSSTADASGAEARGFDAGRTAGFDAGRRQGLANGSRQGLATGQAQGRRAGLAAGRAKGLAEGRASGYASGFAAGRASAIGGLTPGRWYVVRVGGDQKGPVLSGSTAIAANGRVCYTVSGATVLSGHC